MDDHDCFASASDCDHAGLTFNSVGGEGGLSQHLPHVIDQRLQLSVYSIQRAPHAGQQWVGIRGACAVICFAISAAVGLCALVSRSSCRSICFSSPSKAARIRFTAAVQPLFHHSISGSPAALMAARITLGRSSSVSTASIRSSSVTSPPSADESPTPAQMRSAKHPVSPLSVAPWLPR